MIKALQNQDRNLIGLDISISLKCISHQLAFLYLSIFRTCTTGFAIKGSFQFWFFFIFDWLVMKHENTILLLNFGSYFPNSVITRTLENLKPMSPLEGSKILTTTYPHCVPQDTSKPSRTALHLSRSLANKMCLFLRISVFECPQHCRTRFSVCPVVSMSLSATFSVTAVVEFVIIAL